MEAGIELQLQRFIFLAYLVLLLFSHAFHLIVWELLHAIKTSRRQGKEAINEMYKLRDNNLTAYHMPGSVPKT